MGKIFVNYRREDSRAESRLIIDRLQAKFGKRQVFFDVNSLQTGERFDLALDQAVAGCDLMIAVIGAKWLAGEEGAELPRIHGPKDFVRYEIERALHHQKVLLPVLLDGTAMPVPEDLPASLRELTLWNGLPVRHESFEADMAELISEISRKLRTKGVPKKWLAYVAAASLLIGVAAGPFVARYSKAHWGYADIVIEHTNAIAQRQAIEKRNKELSIERDELDIAHRTELAGKNAMLEKVVGLLEQVEKLEKSTGDEIRTLRAQIEELKQSVLSAETDLEWARGELSTIKQDRDRIIGQLAIEKQSKANLASDLQATREERMNLGLDRDRLAEALRVSEVVHQATLRQREKFASILAGICEDWQSVSLTEVLVEGASIQKVHDTLMRNCE